MLLSACVLLAVRFIMIGLNLVSNGVFINPYHYHLPGHLATASANGEIVLWNPNSENKMMKLESRSSQAMKTQVCL